MSRSAVTIKDLAKKLNVSVATIDRALHDRGEINSETKELILRTAREMGYRPNLMARSLVMRQQRKIGLLLPDYPSFFWNEVLSGCRHAAENFSLCGVELDVHTQRNMDAAYTAQLLRQYAENDFCAVVLKPLDCVPLRKALSICEEKGIHIIMLNDRLPDHTPLLYVGPNDRENGLAAGQMMELFLRGKSGTVAIVRSSETQSYSLSQRTQYFHSILAKATPRLKVVDLSDKYPLYDAASLTKLYLDTIPDLCGLYNDSGTIEPIGAVLKGAGRKDIVFIGHEYSPENHRLLEEGYVSAIISQDPFSQGYYAVQSICELVVNGKTPTAREQLMHTDILLESNLSYFRHAL